jgi:glycosyltransferase involved in cell wall biosynthesis
LVPEKGVLEFVDELARIPDSWSRALIAGTRQAESYARAVQDRLEALDLSQRIRLVGHVENLSAFFGETDVLVVPSVGSEGQPTVIIEALAHRRPVVVREPTWSEDFAGLPVVAYRDPSGLGRALSKFDVSEIDSATLAQRFGPAQFLDALERAAATATK